jgi:GNAT superfamily N-acetyltransferase
MLVSDAVIREVKSTDASFISQLIGELGYPSNPQQMRNRLLRIERDPTFRTFVCEVSGNIVGVVGIRVGSSYHTDSVDAHILILIVTAKFRRNGIGKLLVAAAEKWAVRQGATRVFVTSQIDQKDALEFCEKKNYLHTGHRFTKEFTDAGPSRATLIQ